MSGPFPCSIPACGGDHGQKRKGLVGSGQPGRVGLWYSEVAPGGVMFGGFFYFSSSFVNKHVSKGLAGCWNWYQF